MRLHVFYSILEPLFGRLTQQLRADGAVAESSGCVWGRQSFAALRDCGIDTERLLVLSRVFASLPSTVDYPFLESYEDASAGITGPLLVTADRVVCHFDYEHAMAHVEAALRAVEAAFDRWQPDALFMDDVSCIPSYAHFLVAKRRRIPTLILGTSRLPERLMLYSNPYALFDDVEIEYRSIRNSGLSPQERADSARYIASLTESEDQPPYMAYMGRRPAVGGADVRELRSLWRAGRLDPGNYTLVTPWRAVQNRALRIVRARAFARDWEDTVPGERYVLFPLHYQPEASTSVRAPFFIDQCALAENVARSLPAGCRLYIKEHSAGLGRRPYAEWRRLRRIPGARLINPYADSVPLIERAAAVAVITGTMGWEALLRRVPVVTFGRVFFEACASVHRAGAPEGYPSLFRTAMTTAPQLRDVEEFVAAMLRASFPGRTGHPHYLPEVLHAENVKTIAAHLARACELRVKAIA